MREGKDECDDEKKEEVGRKSTRRDLKFIYFHGGRVVRACGDNTGTAESDDILPGKPVPTVHVSASQQRPSNSTATTEWVVMEFDTRCNGSDIARGRRHSSDRSKWRGWSKPVTTRR